MRISGQDSGGSGADPRQSSAASRRLAQLASDLGVDAADDEPWWSEHTRVAKPRATSVDRPDDTVDRPAPVTLPGPALGDAVTLPRPGRHAARRRLGRPGWLRWGRAPGLTPAHLTVLAVVVAVAIGGTAWWLVRDRAEPVAATPTAATAAPLVPQSGEAASGAEVSGGPTAAATGSVTVDVAGKVRRPGIVVLESGARVVDALKAAGGARRGVDTSGLNLARVLVDGEQIVVGARAAPAAAPPASGDAGGPASGPGALVNLNLADQTTLETLPQVGPVTAAAIVSWREDNGGFTSVDELLEIDGIGEKTLAQISPYVTV